MLHCATVTISTVQILLRELFVVMGGNISKIIKAMEGVGMRQSDAVRVRL